MENILEHIVDIVKYPNRFCSIQCICTDNRTGAPFHKAHIWRYVQVSSVAPMLRVLCLHGCYVNVTLRALSVTGPGCVDIGGSRRSLCLIFHIFYSFTKIDANVTCRSLGFLHGNFTYHSFAKNVSDYILYERPMCRDSENDIRDCPGRLDIRMGSHVCGKSDILKTF